MRDELRWAAMAIAMVCSMPARGLEIDTSLLPVHYDVYLKEDHSLYPFAVGHPCGAIVTLRANKLPMNVRDIELSWAYELDAKGGIKTKWPLPVDASPLAIDGNKLIIHQFNVEGIVFVTVEGGIGIDLDGPPKAPPLESKARNLVECPAGADESNICSRLVDVATGTIRIVSYPPVCT
jgi:hypothetical protein